MKREVYCLYCLFSVIFLCSQSLKSIQSVELSKQSLALDSVFRKFDKHTKLDALSSNIEPAQGFTPLIIFNAKALRFGAFYLIANPLVLDQKSVFSESSILRTNVFFPKFLDNPYTAGIVEYGISDRFSVGVMGGMKFNINSNTKIDKTKTESSESLNYYGALYGHYNLPVEALFYFLTTLRVPYQFGKFSSDDSVRFEEFTYTSYGADLELGLAFKPVTIRFAYLYVGIFSLAYRVNEVNSKAYIPDVVNIKDQSTVDDLQASNFTNNNNIIRATIFPKVGLVILINDSKSNNKRRR